MGKVYVFDHPLIQHKTAMIRDKNTSVKDFRELVREISMLMAYEVTRDLPLKDVEIETPLCTATMKMLQGEDIAIVPILRAGLGMVDGMLELVPNAKVGHIGLYRDPDTHMPVEYYCKLPADIENRQVIVVDPMLATGSSLVKTIHQLKDEGTPKEIHIVTAIACTVGIEYVKREQPTVTIWCGDIDDELTAKGYIVPGLGDAGDLAFGAKIDSH